MRPWRLTPKTFFLVKSVTPDLHPKRMWFREVPSGTKRMQYPLLAVILNALLYDGLLYAIHNIPYIVISDVWACWEAEADLEEGF